MLKLYLRRSLSVTALSAVLLAPYAYAAPPVWDNFRGKVLNSGRWLGGKVDSGAVEIRRKINKNGLRLRLRGIGDRENTTGQRHRVVNRLWMSAESAVTARSIQTSVTVSKVDAVDCSDVGAADTRTEYRNHSTWFNDGQSTGYGDRLGDVFSYIGLRKTSTNGLADGQLDIIAVVSVCDDDDCSGSTNLYADSLGIYSIGTKVSLRTTWDENSQVIRFYKKQKGEDAVVLSYPYADDVVAAGDPGVKSEEQHSIQIRSETADCDIATSGSEPPYGYMKATVWNVRLADTAVGN